MKILIWILCIFANAIVTTLLKEAGVLLGGNPTALLFGGTLWLARALCKKWDERKLSSSSVQNLEFNCEVNGSADDDIKFCRKCGEKLITNSEFCGKCGTKIFSEINQTKECK